MKKRANPFPGTTKRTAEALAIALITIFSVIPGKIINKRTFVSTDVYSLSLSVWYSQMSSSVKKCSPAAKRFRVQKKKAY